MTETAARPRSTWGLLTRGSFALLFWGKLTANTGSWMHSILAAIVVYRVTGSAAAVALVSVSQFTPQILLAPLCGSWADRGNLVRQLAVGRSLCVAGSGGLALIMPVTGSPTSIVVAVFVCSVVAGIGFAVDGPAMQSIVPLLVGRDEIRRGMLLNTLPTTMGRLLGPVAGAFAAAHVSASLGFAIAAGLHGVLLLFLVAVTAPGRAAVERGSTSVRDAVRYLRTAPVLMLSLAGTVAVGAGSEPTLTLAPSLADRLDGGDRLVGELSLAFGIGALVGVLVSSVSSRWVTVRFSACLGLVMIGAGSVAAGLVPSAGFAMVAFAMVGLGFSSGMAGYSTLLQHYTHDAYRGRIMALWMVAFVGSRPLAALLVGTAGDLVGVEAAFAGAGLLVLATAWACRPARIRAALLRGGQGARPRRADQSS